MTWVTVRRCKGPQDDMFQNQSYEFNFSQLVSPRCQSLL